MSLKDMCLINHLKEIDKCGVTSLKIEGRMKGPEYVATVISTYRKYLDNNVSVSEDDYKNLETIFFRGGFSSGMGMMLLHARLPSASVTSARTKHSLGPIS